MIERAIRASVTELQAASNSGDENKAIQRAIRASAAEATQARNAVVAGNGPDSNEKGHELHQAVQRSMSLNYQGDRASEYEGGDDSGVDTDEDENIKTAIERSRSDHHQPQGAVEQLPREGEHPHRARTDEEIVLDYVQKQSLLEEEHRRALASRADAASEASDDRP
ncbi:MAG: hypothetical protein Q9198_010973 [Flavoplaca austrocitrina]